MLSKFTALATTCAISPGTEKPGANGMLHVRQRTFTDVVVSDDPRIAGTNKPVLDIDIDTGSGTAEIRGTFTLAAAQGSWSGELLGKITDGMVRASGVARGAGSHQGAVLSVSFHQVAGHSTPPPCATPMAYFEMEGIILDR